MTITPREWMKEPEGEMLDGVLKADLSGGDVSFPISLGVRAVPKEEFTMDSPQDFIVVLEATPQTRVFEDEEAFYNRGDIGLPPDFEAETYLPVGLYPPDYVDFDISEQAIISGKVIDICENPEQYGFPSNGILMMMSCRGYEFQVRIPMESITFESLAPGNIIAGTFFVQGWPAESMKRMVEEYNKEGSSR